MDYKLEELIREVKEWIAALESGNYNQTQGRLKGKDSFCCLGVLCDLTCGWVKDIIEYQDKAVDYYSYPPNNLISKFHLDEHIEQTKQVREWLAKYNLENEIPFNYKNTIELRMMLVILNDSGKVTFKEIADFLRKFYLPLLKNEQV